MLILHVGTQKTGSSSIQHFLRPNRDALLGMGLDFIRAARGWIDHNKLAHELRGGSEDTPLLDAVVAEVQASKAPMQLVSGEMLFHPRVANRLARRMPEALRARTRIVTYLRRPDELMESLYKQRVKTGAIQPKPKQYLDGARYECDYLATLDAFEAAFDRGAMIVRPYRRDLLEGGDILADFLGVLGLPGAIDLPREKPEDNPTFSAAVSELMGTVVRRTPFHSAKVNEILAVEDMPGIRRAGDVYTLQHRRALMNELRPGLDEIATRYGGRLAEVFAAPDLEAEPPGSFPRPPERVELYRAAANAVISAIGKLQREEA
ncbi:hypothetical protein GI374_09830 [Paracoccus sp. S-4012]|uniref:hypothetical protein n=1 Tax=Paracoccus sp. S-4012 TaxID=2665648 RepID=UPI0012AFC2FD|nr:hypothetical protein [Paracoccus sp. S-4012]MRX50739.1 hypothetical protein [Paracoccus sp. S-4012]